MRIGYDLRPIIGRPLIGGKSSGVEEYSINLLKSLLALDKRHSYILFANSFRSPNLSLISDLLVNHKNRLQLKVFRWPNKIFDQTASRWHYPLIDKLIGGVDIYFTPHLSITPLSSKCKYIFTLHDLTQEILPQFWPWRKKFWYWSQRLRLALKRADKVITVSQHTKADLIDLYKVALDKISVIYPGLNIPLQQHQMATNQTTREIQEKLMVVKKYSLPATFLLFLGALEPRKNIESLLLAFEKLQQESTFYHRYHLVIAGSQGWRYKNIYKLANQLKSRDKIHFIGFVDQQDKPLLYQLAQIFIYPSFYEGFGFPPLEAMAMGTPVITSHTTSLVEVVGEAALTIDPYNVNDLFSACHQLLIDPFLRDSLKEVGFRQSKKFSWAQTARQTLELFSQVVD